MFIILALAGGVFAAVLLARVLAERSAHVYPLPTALPVSPSFVGGLTHEMQNPLNFVVNFSSVALESVREHLAKPPAQPSDEWLRNAQILAETAQWLDLVHQHGMRASHVVSSLALYARGEVDQRIESDFNATIRTFAQLAWQSFLATHPGALGAPILVEGPTDASKTFFSPNEIGRVLFNLVTNALESVHQRWFPKAHGRVTIETSICNGQARLMVSDNGCGIRTEDKPHIFDPFFTTRAQEDGMGLGLAVSASILNSYGGKLHLVSSAQEDGTTFEVEIDLNIGAHCPI